ncbi:MAG: hypothetical protein ACKN9D_04800 [Actinomycetales bacterium]
MSRLPVEWYARRWVRALSAVVGAGLLLFAVIGPLTLTFLSVSSLGCLPGTACESWATLTLPLGGICALVAIAGGVTGMIHAVRPRRALLVAEGVCTVLTGLTMVALIVATQAASAGRAQVAAAQLVADQVAAAAGAELRETLGFDPILQGDPKGQVMATGPDQQFLACDVASGQGAGYRVQIGYRLSGLTPGQQSELSGAATLTLLDGGQAAASLAPNADGSSTWQVVTACQELPAG